MIFFTPPDGALGLKIQGSAMEIYNIFTAILNQEWHLQEYKMTRSASWSFISPSLFRSIFSQPFWFHPFDLFNYLIRACGTRAMPNGECLIHNENQLCNCYPLPLTLSMVEHSDRPRAFSAVTLYLPTSLGPTLRINMEQTPQVLVM